MLLRPVFRAARASAPLKQNIRRYASESSSGSGSSRAILGLVGITALGGGGYYYYSSKNSSASNAVASGPAPKAFQGGDQGFLSLKLESVEDVSPNTKKFRFALPEANMVSGLPVASAVVTKNQKSESEKPVIRPYTPTSDEEEQGHIDFVIKRYPNGPMSEHLHSLTPGQTLDIKGPIPKYPMEENKHNHIVMIAGGTGITPMWQVLRNIFKNPNDKTEVTLVYGNVTEEDILLRKELNELQNTYPRRFHPFYLLDKPSEGWEHGKGYITKDLLKEVMPEPKAENVKIFVCGPPGLYKAVSGTKNSPTDQGELSGILKELGYSKDHVFKF